MEIRDVNFLPRRTNKTYIRIFGQVGDSKPWDGERVDRRPSNTYIHKYQPGLFEFDL